MQTRTYLFFIITALLGCLSSSNYAQTSVNQAYVSVVFEDNSFESEIHQSILALKRAEMNLKDSVVASQLEKIGYLAIAQSGFSTSKTDINNRAGYWMLSYPIAIKYGLRINTLIDERNNLAKSTQAAYRYLQELNSQYESESTAELVFMESAIAITKFKKNTTSSSEASASIAKRQKNLDKIKKIYFEASIKAIGPEPPVVSVTSSKPLSFEAIHHFTQIPSVELENLNPEWIANRYDPSFGALKLPVKYKEVFEKSVHEMEQKTRDAEVLLLAENSKRIKMLKGNIPDLNTHKPIRYKVKAGDNLGRISQRYHVKISTIRAWNELKSDRIYAGQKLIIYVQINQKIEKQVVAKKPTVKEKSSTLKKGEYQEYTVKSGDTLWGISQLFEAVTADVIMEDNGIDEGITPGQVLKIRKPK